MQQLCGPVPAIWGHDKIGATAYANLDKKGTKQKIRISRKARIVRWIGFRTALWTIAGTPWPNFRLWRQSGVRFLAGSRVVAYRPLLSADQWTSLLAAPADERNLIRYASLSGEDLDLIPLSVATAISWASPHKSARCDFRDGRWRSMRPHRLCLTFLATNWASVRLFLLTMLGATKRAANI